MFDKNLVTISCAFYFDLIVFFLFLKKESQNECVEPPLSPKLVGSAISSNFAQGGAILDTNDSHKNNMPTYECRIHHKHRTFTGFIAWVA